MDTVPVHANFSLFVICNGHLCGINFACIIVILGNAVVHYSSSTIETCSQTYTCDIVNAYTCSRYTHSGMHVVRRGVVRLLHVPIALLTVEAHPWEGYWVCGCVPVNTLVVIV